MKDICAKTIYSASTKKKNNTQLYPLLPLLQYNYRGNTEVYTDCFFYCPPSKHEHLKS